MVLLRKPRPLPPYVANAASDTFRTACSRRNIERTARPAPARLRQGPARKECGQRIKTGSYGNVAGLCALSAMASGVKCDRMLKLLFGNKPKRKAAEKREKRELLAIDGEKVAVQVRFHPRARRMVM